MEIKYGLNVSTGHRSDYVPPNNGGNFYSPKYNSHGTRAIINSRKVSLSQFVGTIDSVFSNGGDYSDVAKELGISDNAVKSRVKKLRETIPALPKVESKIFSEASAILAKLGCG